MCLTGKFVIAIITSLFACLFFLSKRQFFRRNSCVASEDKWWVTWKIKNLPNLCTELILQIIHRLYQFRNKNTVEQKDGVKTLNLTL